MKAKFYCLLTACCLLLTGLSLNAQEKEFNYVMDVYHFHDVDGTPYLEAHIAVHAAGLHFAQLPNGNWQDTLDIHFMVQDLDNGGEMVYDQEFALVTQEFSDTTWESVNQMVTDVYRIPVGYGKHNFIGTLIDVRHPDQKVNKFESEILISGRKDAFSFSDIQFLQYLKKAEEKSAYTKHGYDIVPVNNNNTFIDQDTLNIYVELYNTNKLTEGKYFLATNITQANSDRKIPQYQRTTRKTANQIDVFNLAFDIRNLPSQTYYLNLEIYNLKNEVVANKSEKFWVSNSRIARDVSANPEAFNEIFALNEEELDAYIRSLRYISRPSERDMAKALKTKEEKENYFFGFWDRRKEPGDATPEKVWGRWKRKVAYMEENYGSKFRKGWESDRGRIFAQYGEPQDIERYPVQGAHIPHEIWYYDKVGTQSQVFFVFWYPDLATGDYTLLHSNKFGEVQNPNWELRLRNRVTNDANIDRNQGDDWNFFQKTRGTSDRTR